MFYPSQLADNSDGHTQMERIKNVTEHIFYVIDAAKRMHKSRKNKDQPPRDLHEAMLHFLGLIYEDEDPNVKLICHQQSKQHCSMPWSEEMFDRWKHCLYFSDKSYGGAKHALSELYSHNLNRNKNGSKTHYFLLSKKEVPGSSFIMNCDDAVAELIKTSWNDGGIFYLLISKQVTYDEYLACNSIRFNSSKLNAFIVKMRHILTNEENFALGKSYNIKIKNLKQNI